MNEIVLKINQTHSIFESDILHSELRILDWILYQVCSNEIKKSTPYLLYINRVSKIKVVQSGSYCCVCTSNIILHVTWPHNLTGPTFEFARWACWFYYSRHVIIITTSDITTLACNYIDLKQTQSQALQGCLLSIWPR